MYDLGELKTGYGGVTVVFGGQVGSEGKGAVAGYLALRQRFGAAICAFMTNAGHTWVGDDGTKVMVQQLPIALVNPEIHALFISPGAGITVSTLLDEIQRYDAQFGVAHRLKIHPRAVIIEDRHADINRAESVERAGVGKGCSRANAEKSMRSAIGFGERVKLARDVPELREFIADTDLLVNSYINSGWPVLVEGAQGFDLDINHGFDYPHCTSRQCTPAQVLADCGIDGKLVTRSIAVLRTYPIRVGNIEKDGEQVGYSGDYGQELSWEEIAHRSGADHEKLTLVERTTVTKRIRRVFEIAWDRLGVMSQICRPTEIALTFVDYLDHGLYGKGTGEVNPTLSDLPHVREFVQKVEGAVARNLYRPKVTLLKTGPRDGHTINLGARIDPSLMAKPSIAKHR